MAEKTKQFGDILRQYRNQTRDPENGKALTQQRFTDLLYEKTGIQYTHGAVSEWERNKSSINKDDRITLVGLIWVLFDCGGIQERNNGDYLLETGNYRALSVEECQKISPQWAIQLKEDPPQSGENSSIHIILTIIFTYIETFLLTQEPTDNSSPPHNPTAIWLEIMGFWLNRKGSFAWLLQMLIWMAIATAIVLLVFPMMYWELTPSFTTIWRYIIGATVLPLLTAALIWLYSKNQWQLDNKRSDGSRLLFMMSGALAGFHTSILMIFIALIFLFALGGIYLSDISIIWQLFLAGLFVLPVTIYTSHQMAQYVWNAFHTFPFIRHDVILLGLLLSIAPLWGFLVSKFVPHLTQYPLLGLFVSFGLIGLSLFWLNKQKKSSIISIPVLVIALGLVWLLFIARNYGVWAINGIITATLWLAISYHIKKFQVTLRGALFFFCAVSVTAFAYVFLGETFGRMAALSSFIIWWGFFRQSLRFNWSFLLIIGAWMFGFYLDTITSWQTEWVIAGVSLFSLLVIGGEWWQSQRNL